MQDSIWHIVRNMGYLREASISLVYDINCDVVYRAALNIYKLPTRAKQSGLWQLEGRT